MVDFEAYSQPPLFNFIRIKHINYMMQNQQKNASNEIRKKKGDKVHKIKTTIIGKKKKIIIYILRFFYFYY